MGSKKRREIGQAVLLAIALVFIYWGVYVYNASVARKEGCARTCAQSDVARVYTGHCVCRSEKSLDPVL